VKRVKLCFRLSSSWISSEKKLERDKFLEAPPAETIDPADCKRLKKKENLLENDEFLS